MSDNATAHIRRIRTHRLIASRFPTVGIFDGADLTEDEKRLLYILEGATNDRLHLQGRLALVPHGSIPDGPGATMVMAAFLHINEAGARFNDVRLGAWYAALTVETAIAETTYHNHRRLSASAGGFPNTIQIRELLAAVDTHLVDIRGSREDLHDPDPANYPVSQAYAAQLRWPSDGTNPAGGIVYDSVRHPGGTSLCLFSPALVILPVLQGDHYEYRWGQSGNLKVIKLQDVAI